MRISPPHRISTSAKFLESSKDLDQFQDSIIETDHTDIPV